MCYQAEQPLPEITQKTFRLLVWNLHKGQDAGWQQTLNRLAQGRDLLLLQEVLNTQELAAQYSSRFSTALYASAFAYLQQQSGVEILSICTALLLCRRKIRTLDSHSQSGGCDECATGSWAGAVIGQRAFD